MSSPLPEFELPPLNEVVFGVQFEPLPSLLASHYGLYWSRIRSRYPVTEDKPPLPYVLEMNEPKPSPPEIGLLTQMPMPRIWFLDAKRTGLIQLQRDRFIRNWRQVDGSEVYPRFNQLRKLFAAEWQEFRDFAEAEGLGPTKITQCELSYVNHLEPGIGWKDFSDLGSLFAFLKPISAESNIGTPDFVDWNARFRLANNNGGGHIKVSTVFRARDLKIVLALNLTARGAPMEANESIDAWFQAAHEWIVRTFDEITHPAMHRIWGKKL